jgi:hypothetical protein
LFLSKISNLSLIKKTIRNKVYWFQYLYKKRANQYNGKLSGSEFLLDTIVFNEWYQVKKKIKPLYNLKYIVLVLSEIRKSLKPINIPPSLT